MSRFGSSSGQPKAQIRSVGACPVKEEKTYAEAEPLLIAGHEGMNDAGSVPTG